MRACALNVKKNLHLATSAYCQECTKPRKIERPGSTHCTCSTCKRVFSNITNFDAHRVGPTDTRYCIDPTTKGMVEINGLWGSPEGHANEMIKTRRLVAARRARDARRPRRQETDDDRPPGLERLPRASQAQGRNPF